MPRATVNFEDTKRVELKTLPEGFVILRRMSFGEWLTRQEMSMDMEVQGDPNTQTTQSMGFKLNQNKLAKYEFETCIVEHNLEDHSGQPLNFSNPFHFKSLDPKIGQEISDAIAAMNNYSQETVGNSNGSSAPDTSKES